MLLSDRSAYRATPRHALSPGGVTLGSRSGRGRGNLAYILSPRAMLAVGVLSSAPPRGSLSLENAEIGQCGQCGRGYKAPPPSFRRLAS